MSRLQPSDLAAPVVVATIIRAGIVRPWKDPGLYFVEWPAALYKPNKTSWLTLQQLLGPGFELGRWKGRKVVLRVIETTNPDTGEQKASVHIGTPRQWYDLLGLELPQLTDTGT
jgi:hypothetical protein